MKKRFIGYKLKEDCQQFSKAAFKICAGYVNECGIIGHVVAEEGINNLKEAGVLDLWFKPVYEEVEKYVLKKDTPELKTYTIEELKTNPKLIVFLETEEEWEKLCEAVGFKITTSYYGAYCYNVAGRSYDSSSTKISVGTKLKNSIIVLFNQIKFNGNFRKATPEEIESRKRDLLLEEAKEKYPVGTRFISSYDNTSKCKVTSNISYWYGKGNIVVDGSRGHSVYTDGKWAEIITIKAKEFKAGKYTIAIDDDTISIDGKGKDTVSNFLKVMNSILGTTIYGDLSGYEVRVTASDDSIIKVGCVEISIKDIYPVYEYALTLW